MVLGLFVLIGAAAAFLPQKRYRADALVFVQPTNLDSPNFGTATLDLLVPTIIRQVETKRFADDVRNASGRDLGDASLTATNDPGTGVLTITAESNDPAAAAAAANTAAGRLQANALSPAVRFSVLDPAVVPVSPASPRKGSILLGCVVLGLILGLFSAIGANRLRRRVTGADVIREEFGLTVLGEIPGRRRRLQRHPSELLGSGPQNEVASSYHRLRTSFELLSEDCQTIAVTSWGQGEGKTTVTTNLGWLLASLGRRVTLVDLDLRRPALHLPFDLEVSDGVADLGSRGPQLSGITVRSKPTDLPELEVITAGIPYEQPPRVIAAAFPIIARTLESRLVLVDTPPLVAAESAMIASMVDALVIVIDVRRRDPAELEALLQVIKLTRTRVLGVVLNRVRKAPHSRHVARYYRQPPRREASPLP
jgi:Mrp family chromosome partitioning ATPase/capsular polysaccharide biosynthesis protein